MASILKSSVKDIDKDSIEEDLLLAAEIGKSLLERNRELESLLKSTQDYAEEQQAQAEFYLEQVNVLRESVDSYSSSYEHMEAAYQQLVDKSEQQKDEHKLIEAKNQRLWERISNLEKKNEDVTNELKMLQQQIVEQNEIIENLKFSNKIAKNNQISNENTLQNHSVQMNEHYIILNEQYEQINNQKQELESDNKALSDFISELKVQLNLEKWKKDEVSLQMEDIVRENNTLHMRISNLKQEILEWENFAQKEENYRKLAEAFTIRHNIESDYIEHLTENNSIHRSNSLTKAKSCEFIDQSVKRNTGILKSSNLVKEMLSDKPSGSFLSELDTEYADLIQRYEALLEKCKQEGKFNENEVRTRKVQRAIQTLSFDFSTLIPSNQSNKVSTSTSITPQAVTPVSTHDALVAAMKPSVCSICKSKETPNPKSPTTPDNDFRVLFAEIFAKIKESKDV